MKRALVVCLGNICRSPIGEGLLRHHAAVQGLRLQVASAGTSGHHSGEAPDRRSVEVMRRHGLDISGQRSAQLTMKDLERYDVVLAMDSANLHDIEALAARLKERGGSPAELALFDAQADVPDPYYGGADGFESVYAQVDAAAAAWVNRWKSTND
jgi:protein-tyrosine phosphatase